MSSEDPGPRSICRRYIIFVTDGQRFLAIKRAVPKAKWVLPCTDLFPIERPSDLVRKRIIVNILDQVSYGSGAAICKLAKASKQCSDSIPYHVEVFGVRGQVLIFQLESAQLTAIIESCNRAQEFQKLIVATQYENRLHQTKLFTTEQVLKDLSAYTSTIAAEVLHYIRYYSVTEPKFFQKPKTNVEVNLESENQTDDS